MTDTIFVRPSVEGAAIIDSAVNEAIPFEGKHVPNNAHWRRLILRGDLIEGAPASRPENSKTSATPKGD